MKTSRLGCFFAFAGLGPPIGGLLVTITLTATNISQGQHSMPLLQLPSILFATIIFAYIFGILPAALTGALLCWIGVGLPRRRWLLTATATGAAVGLPFGIMLSNMEASNIAVLSTLCAVSALICALYFQPARRGDPELERPHPAENAPDTAPAGD